IASSLCLHSRRAASTVITGYDSHHCRRQPPPLLPLGVNSRDVEQVTPKNGNLAVRTRITGLVVALVVALVGAWVALAAAIICAGAAAADQSQEDQFVALLAQQQIPATDNVAGLVYRAHEICGELDRGASLDRKSTRLNSSHRQISY